jgi:cell division protease FtsH
MKKFKKRNMQFQGGPKGLIFIAIFFAVGLLALTKFTEMAKTVVKVPYSEFLEKLDKGDVKAVKMSGQFLVGKYKDGSQFETIIGSNDPKIWDKLRSQNVVYEVESGSNHFSYFYFIAFLFLFIFLAGLWALIKQMKGSNSGGGGGGIFSMGKSKAKMFMPSTIKDNFNSVAGAKEAKEELADVVDFLKNPDKYKKLGAKITRGVLLVGEPGNGKTLLARAVAGEANCPFFSISGSDFIEVFVGVGAARVRDLFAQARKAAPSIIFIDEIDAVGRHRGSGLGGGHDEREQTLNQLLTEMDGFENSGESVIVIAATNRADVLDKALLRPGRFDRRVHVPYPDLICREEILRVHIKNVKIDPDIDLKKIARGTPGFTGADLANLVNEAAIHASKKGRKQVVVDDFEEARDKIMLGKESKTIILSDEEKKITAYHEGGHALVALLIPEYCDPLHKVTIMPRGGALGVTHSLPERETYLSTKDQMISKVKMALGGRAAEELIFKKLTSGAYSDFKHATEIVRNMVCKLGMSEAVGPVVYGQGQSDYAYSQKTAEKIDQEVQSILDKCYDDAFKILADNKDKLDKLAQTLLEKETLYSEEIYELLGIEPRGDFKLS